MAIRKTCQFLLLLAIQVAWSPIALSDDLGKRGNTWDITEPDLIDEIKGMARQAEKSGKLKDYQEKSKKSALSKIENPPPVPGISKANEPRVFTWDPSYVVPQTIRDTLGNVIAPAGTKLNPLDYTGLSKRYIFIDGRDPAQVAYAKKLITQAPRDRVVLTGGSWLKLSREWNRQVYYDQDASLTRRMKVTRVPSIVSQKGKAMQVEEVVL